MLIRVIKSDQSINQPNKNKQGYIAIFDPLELYMSSSFWLLRVESHDFSQAEKERTACKAKQINEMTTIFTRKDNLLI